MRFIQFFFGSGWWILLYLLMYFILLLTVVVTLAMFEQELKAPGEKTDLASPGSIMVFMIGLGLGIVALMAVVPWLGQLELAWYWKILLLLGVPALAAGVSFPLNSMLAIQQSRTSFWLNVGWCAVVILGALWLLQIARSMHAAGNVAGSAAVSGV